MLLIALAAALGVHAAPQNAVEQAVGVYSCSKAPHTCPYTLVCRNELCVLPMYIAYYSEAEQAVGMMKCSVSSACPGDMACLDGTCWQPIMNMIGNSEGETSVGSELAIGGPNFNNPNSPDADKSLCEVYPEQCAMEEEAVGKKTCKLHVGGNEGCDEEYVCMDGICKMPVIVRNLCKCTSDVRPDAGGEWCTIDAPCFTRYGSYLPSGWTWARCKGSDGKDVLFCDSNAEETEQAVAEYSVEKSVSACPPGEYRDCNSDGSCWCMSEEEEEVGVIRCEHEGQCPGEYTCRRQGKSTKKLCMKPVYFAKYKVEGGETAVGTTKCTRHQDCGHELFCMDSGSQGKKICMTPVYIYKKTGQEVTVGSGSADEMGVGYQKFAPKRKSGHYKTAKSLAYTDETVAAPTEKSIVEDVALYFFALIGSGAILYLVYNQFNSEKKYQAIAEQKQPYNV